MITKLYEYFGIIGIASIVAWVVALFTFMLFVFSSKRTLIYRLAMVLAITGWLLALWNSSNVNFIRVDENAADSAAAKEKDRLREQARDLLEDNAARIRFAEDTEDDRLDLAGVDTSKGDNIYELAIAGKDAPEEDDTPAYKRGPRPTRQRGGDADGPSLDASGVAVEGDSEPEEEFAGEISDEDPRIRKMSAMDVTRAHLSDRLNLLASRIVLIIAIIALLLDYLWRFNSSFTSILPLPVASRLVDTVAPKTHSVYLESRKPEVVNKFLIDSVAKGESFIYFGQNDPIGPNNVHRLRMGPLKLFRLPKLVYHSDDHHYDSKALLDLVWFGRSCAVVIGPNDASELLADLLDSLQLRRIPKARVWRTVHLVWDMDDLIPEDDLTELVWLCERANFKLTLVSPEPLGKELADLFDEYFKV